MSAETSFNIGPVSQAQNMTVAGVQTSNQAVAQTFQTTDLVNPSRPPACQLSMNLLGLAELGNRPQ